jgi:hypothetical protein
MEPARPVEMDAQTDNERVKDNVNEDGTSGILGQRVVPSMCAA